MALGVTQGVAVLCQTLGQCSALIVVMVTSASLASLSTVLSTLAPSVLPNRAGTFNGG